MIVVEVFPGAERPDYIKSQGMFEGTYVRVAGTTRHVEGKRKILLRYSKKHLHPNDRCKCFTLC